MKYPPAPLTPFLASPLEDPVRPSLFYLLTSRGPVALSACASIACRLWNSLSTPFSTPLVCFQSLAASFCKTPGWGTLRNLCVLCVSALSFRVVASVPCFQELTNCPLQPIDFHPTRFHRLTNCFFSNSPVFTNICVALCYLPQPPKIFVSHRLHSEAFYVPLWQISSAFPVLS
jgi:hypothetical protein